MRPNNEILIITSKVLFIPKVENNFPCDAGDCMPFPIKLFVHMDSDPCANGKYMVYQPFGSNEIIGTDGYDAIGSADTFRLVSATQTLAYTVYFENDADLAMATASKVTSTLPLHEKLN